MRLLLDSTYLFPAVNVDITEGWTKGDLLNLIHRKIRSNLSSTQPSIPSSTIPPDPIELYYCDLSLFEIYTKCMKLIIQHKIEVPIEKIQRGVESIVHSPHLHKILWWENIVESEMIRKLKSVHNDSIDCTLFYLSVILCDCFATYDQSLISAVQKEPEILAWIKDINPNFRIWLRELKGEVFRLIPAA